MHWARLAPELPATVTIVRSWIMALSPALLGALDDPHQPPALVLRHRPRLHEADDVADLALVGLVVHLELGPAPHVAAVSRVLHQALDRDHDRFLHPIAHHLADPDLPAIALGRHEAAFSLSFWFSTVIRRASSRRPARILSGLSSCFIELRNRRLNSSVRSSWIR